MQKKQKQAHFRQKEQFATVDELKSFDTDDNDGDIDPAKSVFWKRQAAVVDCGKSKHGQHDAVRGKFVSNRR